MEDVGPLMMSIELLDDLACLWTPSNTSWTLDIALIGLGRCRYSQMCHLEGRKPTTWTLHPSEDVRVWMDAITLDEDGIPFGGMMEPSSFMTLAFSPRTLHI
jgi:hypothetical protein